MKKLHVFGFGERPLALLLKELLEGEGIACLIRNEELFAAMGEIPFVELYPELWVIDDEVYPRARVLLDGWLKTEELQAEPWVCPGCGEKLEGQFGACWKCGQQKS
jgi:hypothetical protein